MLQAIKGAGLTSVGNNARHCLLNMNKLYDTKATYGFHPPMSTLACMTVIASKNK
jgi:hypothetical protein